jgi:hypothetical protein
MRLLATVASSLAISLSFTSASSAAVVTRMVAVSGQRAPGTAEGVSFFGSLERNFGQPPRIDRGGRVAFGSFMAGPGVPTSQMGVWVERDQGLALVVQAGDPVPGVPGSTFLTSGFFPLAPAVAAGRVAFVSFISSSANFGFSGGLFKETATGLKTVMINGDPAPGLPSGVTLQIGVPFWSESGHVLFGSFLRGAGVTANNDESIWSDRSGSLQLVVREGARAPGTSAVFGAASSMFAPGALRLFAANAQSRVLLHGNLAGSGISDFNDEGIWVEGEGGLALVARESQQAPGLPTGMRFGRGNGIDTFASPVPITLNGSGAVLFQASVTGANVNATALDTLWTTRTGKLELLVRGRTLGALPEGDRAPGFPAGVSFTGFTNRATLNDLGRVTFVGVVEGRNVNGDLFDFGIWSDRSGALELVAGDGMPVPDSGGAVFGSPTSSSNTYALVGFTEQNEVFFTTSTSGPGSAVGSGLFLSSPGGGSVRTLLRTGSVVDVSGKGSDLRTVSAFAVGGVSAAGEVAVKLSFTDGTLAVATVRHVF